MEVVGGPGCLVDVAKGEVVAAVRTPDAAGGRLQEIS